MDAINHANLLEPKMKRRRFLKNSLIAGVSYAISGVGLTLNRALAQQAKRTLVRRSGKAGSKRPRIFVRPNRSGGYGKGDGSSHADAYNGLQNAKLISGGVHYFCGFFLTEWDGQPNIATKFRVEVPSGTAGARTELRGDWPDDPGIIVGGLIPTWGPWRAEGDGVYSLEIKAGFGSAWYLENPGPRFEGRPLGKAPNLDACRARPGSFWSDYYSQFRGTRRIFIHMTDGRAPDRRIVFGRYGWGFNYDKNLEYVDMIGLDMKIFGLNSNLKNRLQHCSWRNCKFIYGGSRVFAVWGAAKDIHWKDCEISRAGNGIYFIASQPEHGIVEDYSIVDCHIHDIGTDPHLTNGDDHAIGIQGSRRGLIRGNRIERCGWHIMLYAVDQHDPRFPNGVWYQPMENIVMENNKISGWNRRNRSKGVGISISGDTTHTGSKTGLIVRRNEISGMRLGIRVKSDVNVLVEANYVHDTAQGIRCMGTRAGASCTLRNNRIAYVSDYFVAITANPKNTLYVGDRNRFVLRRGQRSVQRLFQAGRRKINFWQWQHGVRDLRRGSAMDWTSKLESR